MSKIETPNKLEEMPLAVVRNMVVLATSGFGLVVALAWNEFVRQLVSEYLGPLLGESGGLISLFIYAVVVTVLAIVVTMQLSALQRNLEKISKNQGGSGKK